jgi:deoxycytidylate deaminase
MRKAKAIAENPDCHVCPSRQLAAVIANTDPDYHCVLSEGYNGPPRGVPHNDSAEWLETILGRLSQKDLHTMVETLELEGEVYGNTIGEMSDLWECVQSAEAKQKLLDAYDGCGQCPRRILQIPSGQRLDLCSCAHAERNAVANAAMSGVSIRGATMFCWCCVPCHECTTVILNSGISEVVCHYADEDYSPSSKDLFRLAGVKLIRYPKEFFADDDETTAKRKEIFKPVVCNP